MGFGVGDYTVVLRIQENHYAWILVVASIVK